MAASDLTVFISSQELQHDEQVKKSHSRKEENPWEAREDLTCLLKSSPFCSFPTTKQREKHLSFNDSTGGSFAELGTHKTKKLALGEQGEEEEGAK